MNEQIAFHGTRSTCNAAAKSAWKCGTRFKAACETDVNRWLEGEESQSPDDIRQCARLIGSLGEWLNIDASSDVEALEQYAEEKEQETEWEPDTDDYRSTREPEATNAEIESLFSTLPVV